MSLDARRRPAAPRAALVAPLVLGLSIACAAAIAAAPTGAGALPESAPAGGRSARTKAIELRVDGVERLPSIGGRAARPGYEFVVVDTSWTNVLPLTAVDKQAQSSGTTSGFGLAGGRRRADPADITMEPTPFVVPELTNHLWLLTDDRFADPVDLAAQEAAQGHLPNGFTIPALDQTVRGTLVFEAPVAAKYQALQFYDKNHGHALVPVTGSRPASPPAAIGPANENELLRLALIEVRPLPDPRPEGARRFVVGMRGSSRLPNDIVKIPMAFLYAQSDTGCLASPEPDRTGLARPFGDEATFVPDAANEGQLAFTLPADTKAVRLLVRAQNGRPLDLASGGGASPAWPTPVRTIDDGSVARVHVLPTPGPPAGLPPPADGRAYRLVDVVVENLGSRSGIELQYVQLRLQAADGSFIDPLPLSESVPCHLTDGGVIPPTTARRFTLVYDVLPDPLPRRLEYRGFQVDQVLVDLP